MGIILKATSKDYPQTSNTIIPYFLTVLHKKKEKRRLLFILAVFVPAFLGFGLLCPSRKLYRNTNPASIFEKILIFSLTKRTITNTHRASS